MDLTLNVKVAGAMSNLAGGVRGGITGGAKPGGLMGSLGGALGGGALISGSLLVIGTAVKKIADVIEKYMPITGRMMEHIHKGIQMILRPLDMMLTTAMMPLLYIMRPIGLFFNMMMRPYIQKAMQAMKVGGMALQSGTAEGAAIAASSFSLGFQYLVKPFFDAFNTGLMVAANVTIDAFQLIGNAIIDTLDPLGVSNGIQDTMNLAVNTLQDGIADFSTGINGITTKYLDATLIVVEAWGKKFQERINEGLVVPAGGKSHGWTPSQDYVFIDGQGYCIANGGKGP